MGQYDNLPEPIRRTTNVFFVVDISAGMNGIKIAALNEALHNLIPELRSIADDHIDTEIKIAVLTFSNTAEWICLPTNVEDFQWQYLEPHGMRMFGAACEELNTKLSRENEFMMKTHPYAPIIFLFTNGVPTDDYHESLIRLKKNNWFKVATKVAIAIGDDADVDALAEFTGNKEAVIKVHTPETLKKLIRFINPADGYDEIPLPDFFESEAFRAKIAEFLASSENEGEW